MQHCSCLHVFYCTVCVCVHHAAEDCSSALLACVPCYSVCQQMCVHWCQQMCVHCHACSRCSSQCTLLHRCQAIVSRGWGLFREKWGALHPLSRARRFQALATLQPLSELQVAFHPSHPQCACVTQSACTAILQCLSLTVCVSPVKAMKTPEHCMTSARTTRLRIPLSDHSVFLSVCRRCCHYCKAYQQKLAAGQWASSSCKIRWQDGASGGPLCSSPLQMHV